MAIASVVVLTRHAISDGATASQQTSKHEGSFRSAEALVNQRRVSGPSNAGEVSPMQNLSPRLRKLIREFETRAAFMDSPMGFTSDEQRMAMANCQEIIDGLSGDEVEALLRFYQDPHPRKSRLFGNELVGGMLYERWGEIDGEAVVRMMESRLVTCIAKSPGPVDLADPFASRPSGYDIARVFAGWARFHDEDALQAWERIHQELKNSGSAVANLAEFDAQIRRAIAKPKEKPSE